MRRRVIRVRSRAEKRSASLAASGRPCARISLKVIKLERLRAAVALCALFLSCERAANAGGSLAEVDAVARAAGNRKAVAMAIGRKLFARTPSAQILKIRVDGVAGHEVAGIVLSGVKFHQPLDPGGYVREVAELVRETFAASDVEEVDVWAIVPLRVGQHAVVAGDKAVPTSRVVYGATVRRTAHSDSDPALVARLTSGDAVYWDPAWHAGLQARFHRALHDSASPDHE